MATSLNTPNGDIVKKDITVQATYTNGVDELIQEVLT